jgi:putative hemolysin
MLWQLLVIVLLLCLSAFFSGSETTLFSLSPGKREELAGSRPRTAERVGKLLSDPGRLLGTLLLGNLIVNTAASSVFTLALLAMARRLGANEALVLGIGGIIMTVVLLVFAEVTPKVIASRNPSASPRSLPRRSGPRAACCGRSPRCSSA